jgi:Replication-relaxation
MTQTKKSRRKIPVTVRNRTPETIASEDVEERGSLADRFLFWLLKHPYQRSSDLSFIFQSSATTTWRHLQTLTQQALIESVTSVSTTSDRPHALYYLTNEGIKRVADLVGGANPMNLARLWQVNETDLLRLLPRLPSYLLLQETVLKLIADAPRQLAYPGGYPAAIRWHWQRDYLHTFERKKKQMTLRADGAVVFRRRPLRQAMEKDDSWYCFLLFIDAGLYGSEDLRLMRKRLEQLLQWRESSERWSFYHAFPPVLVVAPTRHQGDLWIYSAQEAAAHLRVAPLKGASAVPMENSPWHFSWRGLDGSGVMTLQSLADPLVPQAIPPGLLAPKQMEPGAIQKTRKNGEENIVTGNFEARAKRLNTSESNLKTTAEIALLSACLFHRHRDLLLHIYALPFVAPYELAALMQKDLTTQQRYLYDLHQFRCLQTMETACGKRLVLTEVGLKLVSSIIGVHLAHIAEYDASQSCWQQRGVSQVLRTMKHTAGMYSFLVQLQIQASKIGQEVLWWETTRSLRRYHLQGAWHNLMPDALFEYQAKEVRVEAWLEWDTGSMHMKPLLKKFEAYAQYVRSQHYRQNHRTPPTLLLVAPHNGREQTLRQIAISVLGSLPLRIWTTTEPLLNVQGPLAAIWKPLRSGEKIEGEGRSFWIEEGEEG